MSRNIIKYFRMPAVTVGRFLKNLIPVYLPRGQGLSMLAPLSLDEKVMSLVQ